MEKEIWLPITNDIVSNISNTYYISNYGRIYTTYRNKICKPKNNNTIELALINGNIITSISRIVYKVFIDLMKSLVTVPLFLWYTRPMKLKTRLIITFLTIVLLHNSNK